MVEPAYRELYFGRSDSRNEYNEDRDAFVKSFVDLREITGELRGGGKFLVLGPKGTGKSAVAWFLMATDVPGDHITLVRDASTLPLAEIPRLRTGQAEGPERTVVAWKFILLCNYLELLLTDHACSLTRDPEVTRVAKLLRDFGFMGDASGRALLKASTVTVSIPVPKLGEIYKKESKAELNIYNLIPYIERWVATAVSGSRHVLLLDGLDSIFLNDRKYNESLASLVQAAYSLNQLLHAESATGSIALLLRNDVFSRIALALPDSQKMRDDLGVELDWRVLSGAAGRGAPLLRLVNSKAAGALDVPRVDVLSYFDSDIQLGRPGTAPRWMPTLRYFLNLTRHTPRDLLRLFEEIRQVEESDVFPRRGRKVGRDVIREGVLQYATKYFLGAVRNEFAGFDGGPESAAAALSALQQLNRQRFRKADFATAIHEVGLPSGVTVERLLTLLFYAGAIGNLVARRDHESYLQFYHRRDDSEVYLGGEFILHNALLHAWSIPHSGVQ